MVPLKDSPVDSYELAYFSCFMWSILTCNLSLLSFTVFQALPQMFTKRSIINMLQDLYNSITHWLSHRLPIKPVINHLTWVQRQPAKPCNTVTQNRCWNRSKGKNVTMVPFWTLKQGRELKFNCGREYATFLFVDFLLWQSREKA